MPVDPTEYQPLSVELVNSVLHGQLANAEVLVQDFNNGTIRLRSADLQQVEGGGLCTPQERVINLQRKTSVPVVGAGKLLSVRGVYSAREFNFVCRAGEGAMSSDFRMGTAMGEAGRQSDVHNPLVGAQREVHTAENSEQPPVILVLQPAAAAIFKDTHSQDIFTLVDQLTDVELSSGKAPFAVTGEAAVDPEEEGGLHTFKRQVNGLVQRFCGERKGFQIRAHRVIMGNLSGL